MLHVLIGNSEILDEDHNVMCLRAFPSSNILLNPEGNFVQLKFRRKLVKRIYNKNSRDKMSKGHLYVNCLHFLVSKAYRLTAPLVE